MFSTKRKSPQTINIYILVPAVIISILSVITLMSGYIDPSGHWIISNIVFKQILFALAGIGIYLLLSKFDYTYINFTPILAVIYIGTLILLLLTLFIGDSVKGAQRWITIAGVQLQPSEFAKIVAVITTAHIMTYQKKYNEYLLMLISLVAMMPILIMIYLEPHASMTLIILILWGVTVFFSIKDQLRNLVLLLLGSSIIVGGLGYLFTKDLLFTGLIFLGVLLFILILFSNSTWKFLAVLMFVVSLVLTATIGITWDNILKPYQKQRITTFLNPDSNTQASKDADFNVRQSKIAIGSGRIFGKGWGKGTQATRNFLPEHETDFIFATYAEQTGLVGSLFLVCLYGIMLFTILKFPLANNGDIFASTVIVVLGIKILIEFFINIGTNTGLTPATGIPLPLMSAGGSITLATYLSLGLIQSITNKRKFIDN